ncbi:MAG: hypothetical protein LBJ60_05045 [Tannerellaceae bacterium]|jgi:hypothetical protein|nr:hypothetical protein [Tannerellaceae bacterium]
MKDLFGIIYCLFDSLFGQNLADYLWGYDCNMQSFSNTNVFNRIGLLTLLLSFVIVFSYYYLINHPRFNRWWSWLVMLGVTGATGLFLGYGWTVADFHKGLMGDCLLYLRDANGEITSSLIRESDCWMFGVVNGILSIGFFILFSLAINIGGRLIPRLASRNCKYSPF